MIKYKASIKNYSNNSKICLKKSKKTQESWLKNKQKPRKIKKVGKNDHSMSNQYFYSFTSLSLSLSFQLRQRLNRHIFNIIIRVVLHGLQHLPNRIFFLRKILINRTQSHTNTHPNILNRIISQIVNTPKNLFR